MASLVYQFPGPEEQGSKSDPAEPEESHVKALEILIKTWVLFLFSFFLQFSLQISLHSRWIFDFTIPISSFGLERSCLEFCFYFRLGR